MPKKPAHTAAITNETILWEQGYTHIVGLDEAGRGAWAGGVYAGAVCLPHDQPLRELLEGVRDSKQMTKNQRERLANTIKHYALAWGVGIVEVDEIAHFGISRASALAMERALTNLTSKGCQADYVLTDSIYWAEMEKSDTYRTIVRGDRLSLTISAASVIAKTERDHAMLALDFDPAYQRYQFGKHKGYGTSLHHQLLKQYGASDIHRRTFKPIIALGNNQLALDKADHETGTDS